MPPALHPFLSPSIAWHAASVTPPPPPDILLPIPSSFGLAQARREPSTLQWARLASSAPSPSLPQKPLSLSRRASPSGLGAHRWAAASRAAHFLRGATLELRARRRARRGAQTFGLIEWPRLFQHTFLLSFLHASTERDPKLNKMKMK
jgi:hypothetical protein